MPAGPELVVPAPPLQPPLTGLLQAARVLELAGPAEHWLAGVRFSPEGQVQPDLYDICSGLAAGGSPVAAGSGAAAGPGGFRRPARKFSPFAVETPDVCSTFGWEMNEYEDRARRSLMAREAWAVEREFEQGTLIPSNPHLADSTDPYLQTVGPAGGAAPRDALALLDEAIANAGMGLGMIHATPYIADQWANLRLLDFSRPGPDGLPQPFDGIVGPQRYITSPKGNIIVIGNGYQGIGPDGTGGSPYDATFYDATMAASSTTLTSATAAFVAGDVGKTVVVVGAGASGAALTTTVASVTNATTAVLAAAATTAVQSVPLVIRARSGDTTHASQWAYATDLVQVLRSADITIVPQSMAQATDRAANSVTIRAQREYAVLWSGLVHAAVKIGVTPASSATGGSSSVSVVGSVTTQPTSGSLTDRSGSITTGGTAQTLVAANTSRKYLLVRNPTTATEDLWVNLTGTATTDSPSIKLATGDTFVMEGNFVATNAVSVIAATTGHKITAWEG